eukprot:472372-Amphidinium_carterae.1
MQGVLGVKTCCTVKAGETPADALARFVTSDMAGLSGLLDLGDVEQKVESSDSEWSGIRTRRIESLYNATLKVPVAELAATHIAVNETQSIDGNSLTIGMGGLRKGVLGGITGSMAVAAGGIPFRGFWAEEAPREPSIQSNSGQNSTTLHEGGVRQPSSLRTPSTPTDQQLLPKQVASPHKVVLSCCLVTDAQDLDVFALPTTSKKVPIALLVSLSV